MKEDVGIDIKTSNVCEQGREVNVALKIKETTSM